MNYFVRLLLIGGCFCGGKVINIEGSGRRDPALPVLPKISGFPEVATGPVGGYNEYYRNKFSSLPTVPSRSMALSEMFSVPVISEISGNGNYFGSYIGLSEPEVGDFVEPLKYSLHRQNFHRDIRVGGGDSERDTRRSIVSGYTPRRHQSIFHSGYFPRSRVYFYPPQYAGYHYGFGNLDFFVSGKNNAEATKDNIVALTAMSSGDGTWKMVSTSASRKDGTKSSTSRETVLESEISPFLGSIFKSWKDDASDSMP